MPKIKTSTTASSENEEQQDHKVQDLEVKQVELEYEEDTENKTVSFRLSNGTAITVREPKAIDFLRVKGWRDHAPEDDQSDEMAGYKLVSLCATEFTPPSVNGKPQKTKTSISVYQLLDSFETQADFTMAAKSMEFFRHKISLLTGTSADDLQLQPESVHAKSTG